MRTPSNIAISIFLCVMISLANLHAFYDWVYAIVMNKPYLMHLLMTAEHLV